MDDADFEAGYQTGKRAAARDILAALLPMFDGDERDAAALRAELLDVARALRALYADATGEAPPWPDNLHLADVIEKHIAPLVIE